MTSDPLTHEAIRKAILREARTLKQPNSVGLTGRSAALAVAFLGWCLAIHGAEIHEAAELGDLDKVKALLSQDPKQINVVDAKGRTVLARAIRNGKPEVVEFLLQQGATADIYAAAVVGDVDKVAAFLKQDKKLVNARDSDGRTPLHWAALYGQTKVMALLLADKADVNSLDGDGFTPLHWATTFNRRDAVELLLANKADMNIKVPKYGWTPLRLAVIHGHMEAAKALLDGGADPNVKDDENIPLLHQAIIRGKKEMVELLLDKKADVNKKDADLSFLRAKFKPRHGASKASIDRHQFAAWLPDKWIGSPLGSDFCWRAVAGKNGDVVTERK